TWSPFGLVRGVWPSSWRQPVAARLGDQDLRAGGVGLDLLAQPVDVGLQRVGGDAGVVAPDLGQKLLAADRLLPGAVEGLQGVGLLLRQAELALLGVDQGLVGGAELVSSQPEHRAFGVFVAAQL